MTKTAKRLLIALLASVVSMLALFLILMIVFSYVFAGPSIPEAGILVLELEGDIPEVGDRGLLSWIIHPFEATLCDYSQMLDRAAEDDRVKGVVMRIRPLQTGWARASELRRAALRFREESEKPIVGVLDIGMNPELYLASAADRVFMAQEGILLLGLRAEVPYVKGVLEKLKIEPEFEKAGKYKDGPEMFTRRSMSDPSREALEALIDSIYDQYAEAVASGRSDCVVSDVKSAWDRSLLDAEKAIEMHLVDEMGHMEAARAFIEKEAGEEDLEEVFAETYVREIRSGGFSFPDAKLAMIVAEGPIMVGESSGGLFEDVAVASDTMVRTIDEIADEEDIDGILLRIDSPGGSMLASDLIWAALERAKAKEKKVYVSMGDVAASGGYYIAMGADHIVAESNTITGSIGVYFGKMNMKGFYDWIGVDHDVIQRGENAGIFSDITGLSDGQREFLKEEMASAYKDFVTKAAEGRGMTYEEMDAVAQGRVWSGTDAFRLGLVDELGGISESVAAAKRDLGLDPDATIRLKLYPREQGFFGAPKDLQATALQSQLPKALSEPLCWMKTLEAFENEPILVLWPEGLRLEF